MQNIPNDDDDEDFRAENNSSFVESLNDLKFRAVPSSSSLPFQKDEDDDIQVVKTPMKSPDSSDSRDETNSAKKRKFEFIPRWETEYGVEVVEKDPISGAPQKLRCLFCQHYGREENNCQLKKEERKKSKAKTIKHWATSQRLRAQSFRQHIKLNHPILFENYNRMTKEEKENFFPIDDTPPVSLPPFKIDRVDQTPRSLYGSRTLTKDLDMDVYVTEENYIVVVNVPGFSKQDISVSFNEQNLTVTVDHTDREFQDFRALIKERKTGSLKRTITLPEDCSFEKAKAKQDMGVLRITLDKIVLEKEEGKIIPIDD